MPFDDLTRTLLQQYTQTPPRFASDWGGPWNNILVTLFPQTEGYIITPQRPTMDGEGRASDHLVIEVAKLSASNRLLSLRTGLIVEIKNTNCWDAGITDLMKEMRVRADELFVRSVVAKVYWIAVIGPHWTYGEREEYREDDVTPSIEWHHETHDEASYDDLQELKCLIAGM